MDRATPIPEFVEGDHWIVTVGSSDYHWIVKAGKPTLLDPPKVVIVAHVDQLPPAFSDPIQAMYNNPPYAEPPFPLPIAQGNRWNN